MSSKAEKPEGLPAQKVLLVEDDLISQKILRKQLQRPGFEVIACSSGEEALEAQKLHPDVRIIVTDWDLPGLSGVDICQIFRKDENYHYILMLTASQGDRSKLKALNCGADAFLSKPANPADLLAHLNIAERIINLQTTLQSRLSDLEKVNADLQREIVARQAAEKELVQTTAFLKHLIDGLPFGILLVNALGIVVHTNDSFCTLFELSVRPHVLVGKMAAKLLENGLPKARDAEAVLAFVKDCEEIRPPRSRGEFELTDGRTLAVYFSPVELSDHLQGNLWIYSDVSEEVAARQFEVKIASQVQRGILMSPPPLDMNLDIACINLPSLQVDGDFVDFHHGGDFIDIVVGDVMGKGIPAALLGAGVKTQLLRLQSEQIPSSKPSRYVHRLNQVLMSDLTALGSFVTLFYARVDLIEHTVTYVDAGNTKPFHWSAPTHHLDELEGPNVPLGFSKTEEYEELVRELNVGDYLIFYSDGVTEALNPAGDQLGMVAVREYLQELLELELSAQEVVDCLFQLVNDYQGGQRQSDDISIVVVRIREFPGQSFLRRAEMQCHSDIQQLPVIRDFVSQTCQDMGLQASDEWNYQVELAVSEVVSNIMRHAFGDRRDGTVRVLVRVFANEIRVRVYHNGEPIPPHLRRPDLIKEPREGGMGLFLLGEVTDQVLYGSEPGNIHWVEFRKSITPE